MNKINTERLFLKYPEFFKHRDNLMSSLMGFGFDCKNGWYDLIDKLCGDIKNHYISEYGEIPEHFYVVQVKEKFGGLRFYVTSATVEIHDMIDKAEHDSYYICEVCGKECPHHIKGKPFKSFYRDELPWIQTICDECLKEHLDKMGLSFNSYVSSWQKKHKAPFVVVK